MKIAFVLYDGITLLDFAGVYDPITRLKTMGFVKDLTCDICAQKEKIRSFEGIELVPDTINSNLSPYDYVIIPGGNGIKDLMRDTRFLDWILIKNDTTIIAAVCGGALLAGATGKLRDKTATTHPELQGFLKNFAGTVSRKRVVEDKNIITAGGVTSAIDMGLFICEKIAGHEVREKIQAQMDYPHYPARP
jgi:transcriptional regulator GlxA family with amidase domain